MKKIPLIILCLCFFGCATTINPNHQTIEFRHFVRDFFQDKEYQITHIKFPVEYTYYEDKLVTQHINKSEWKHLNGPEYYRCQLDCYDIVIYDNFKRRDQETGKRVLSFEGVNNGINSALYFELMDGEWFLVKHEDFDN